MPTGTKVDSFYEKLKASGHSVESAVRIAQAVTGQALATGKKPKNPTKGKREPIRDSTKFNPPQRS